MQVACLAPAKDILAIVLTRDPSLCLSAEGLVQGAVCHPTSLPLLLNMIDSGVLKGAMTPSDVVGAVWRFRGQIRQLGWAPDLRALVQRLRATLDPSRSLEFSLFEPALEGA